MNGIVKIEVAPGLVISSSITNAAIEELGLTVGSKAVAVIKAPTSSLVSRTDPFKRRSAAPQVFLRGRTVSGACDYCPRLTDSSSMTATSRTSGSFWPDEAVVSSAL